MKDIDPKMKNDSDDSIENIDSSIEPELLGVELSEELKKADPNYVAEIAAGKDIPIPAADIVTPNVSSVNYDVEIRSDESLPNVPKKEFSMPEQSKQVDEIVESYVPGSSLANSAR